MKMIELILKLRKYGKITLEKMGLLEFYFDFYTFYQNIRPLSRLDSIYNCNYISNRGYDSAEDLRLKESHARETARLLNPKKVLVAGCAQGNAVLAFHNLGIEAWGFDIIPCALPENHYLRTFIKQGSILNIPFSREDNFDTFVCTDVFEHIYIKDIPQMVNEIYRIGADSLALIINHDGLCQGHVTLKPLTWWVRQFQGKYRLADSIKTTVVHGCYGLDPSSGRPYFTFWEKWKNRSRPQSG
jgi:hypothetical protein